MAWPLPGNTGHNCECWSHVLGWEEDANQRTATTLQPLLLIRSAQGVGGGRGGRPALARKPRPMFDIAATMPRLHPRSSATYSRASARCRDAVSALHWPQSSSAKPPSSCARAPSSSAGALASAGLCMRTVDSDMYRRGGPLLCAPPPQPLIRVQTHAELQGPAALSSLTSATQSTALEDHTGKVDMVSMLCESWHGITSAPAPGARLQQQVAGVWVRVKAAAAQQQEAQGVQQRHHGRGRTPPHAHILARQHR